YSMGEQRSTTRVVIVASPRSNTTEALARFREGTGPIPFSGPVPLRDRPSRYEETAGGKEENDIGSGGNDPQDRGPPAQGPGQEGGRRRQHEAQARGRREGAPGGQESGHRRVARQGEDDRKISRPRLHGAGQLRPRPRPAAAQAQGRGDRRRQHRGRLEADL